MNKRSFFQNLLIGKEDIESRSEYKYALLRGQLGLLLGGICLMYIFVDTINGVSIFIPWYLLFILCSIIIIYLNRIRKHLFSTILLIIISNIVVYFFAAVDNPVSGVFFFFTAAALIALILFDRIDRLLSYIFIGITIGLALLAYFGDFSPIPPPVQSEFAVKTNFVINFILGLLSSVLILHFVLKRNSEAEKILIGKQEELLKINEELDRFVYSASHDMRAPLSTMLGLLQLTERSKDPQELPKYYDMMRDRIHTMEGFIRDITDYSRNARVQLNLDEISLIALVDEVVKSFEVLAAAASCLVKVEIDPSIVVITDRHRLKVVLNNLLLNSIKYCDPEKTQSQVQITAQINDDGCIITVSDNGLGIEAEYLDRVFEMFYRASEKSDGSGLGLYIVREAMNKLGGDIRVVSKIGEGSQFRVILP